MSESQPKEIEPEELEVDEGANVSLYLRDRSMQMANNIPGITYDSVEKFLDAVDQIEARLTTGERLRNDLTMYSD